MIRRLSFFAFSIIFIISIVVGCSNNENNNVENASQNEEVNAEKAINGEPSDEEDKDEEPKADQDQKNSDNDTGNNTNQQSNDTDINDNGKTTSNKDLPDDIEINERIQHPTGVIVTLESIAFEDDYISVKFMVQNGYRAYVKLDLDGVALEDDTGFFYSFQPVDLRVEENERMEGTLNFIGRLDDEASSLTLSFNQEADDDDMERDDTQYPKIVFDDIQIER